jgi:hypothetical protein
MSAPDEQLMAYVDGELDAAQAAAFEARIAAEPALQRAVQAQRQVRQQLAAAYDPVLQEPVPASLQALLAAPAPAAVLELAAERRRRAAAAPARQSAWWALAASLALGVGLGWFGARPGAGEAAMLARAADGQLLASGVLAQQLTAALAAEPPQAGVAVGLSFAARDGRFCRSFALEGAALAGLACRGEAGWAVRGLAPAGEATAPGAYRTAATALPPALLQQLDALRAGDTLDAAAERAARDAGWAPLRR